jgi:hypothetical protein
LNAKSFVSVFHSCVVLEADLSLVCMISTLDLA